MRVVELTDIYVLLWFLPYLSSRVVSSLIADSACVRAIQMRCQSIVHPCDFILLV